MTYFKKFHSHTISSNGIFNASVGYISYNKDINGEEWIHMICHSNPMSIRPNACRSNEIVVIPHINNQSNDMYQLYYKNIRKQSDIWLGLIEPFSIDTATIYEQKISVRINANSIKFLLNNTYYTNWYIVGLDVYGK